MAMKLATALTTSMVTEKRLAVVHDSAYMLFNGIEFSFGRTKSDGLRKVKDLFNVEREIGDIWIEMPQPAVCSKTVI
jgi:hypothetical protein